MDYKYTAIILSKCDIGEYDRLYTAYTKEAGKIRVVARGIRKPNSKLAGNIEPVTESELIIARGRGRGQLTGVIPLETFSGVKNDLDLTRQVFYIFGVFGKIISEEEKDERLYGLLSRYLSILDNISQDEQMASKAEMVTAGFIYKILSLSGYKLEADKCAECGGSLSEGESYFNMKSGGAICKNCRASNLASIKMNPAGIKAFRIFSKNRLESLVKLSVSGPDMKNIKMVLDRAVRWIT